MIRVSPEELAEIERLGHEWKRIPVIKLIKEISDLSLKEAKELVDRWMPPTEPGDIQTPQLRGEAVQTLGLQVVTNGELLETQRELERAVGVIDMLRKQEMEMNEVNDRLQEQLTELSIDYAHAHRMERVLEDVLVTRIEGHTESCDFRIESAGGIRLAKVLATLVDTEDNE